MNGPQLVIWKPTLMHNWWLLIKNFDCPPGNQKIKIYIDNLCGPDFLF
jgi:hypothetical protein